MAATEFLLDEKVRSGFEAWLAGEKLTHAEDATLRAVASPGTDLYRRMARAHATLTGRRDKTARIAQRSCKEVA